MHMRLQQLSPEDGRELYDFLQTIPAEEHSFYNSAYGLSYEAYKDWLILMDGYSRGEGMEEWRVPSTEYWCMVDDQPVGIIRLRHRLTPALRMDGGHIGYGIAPAYRNKGYGKAMLKELLQIAKAMNINDLLITANQDNLASRHVIEANHGILEKEEHGFAYYWIHV